MFKISFSEPLYFSPIIEGRIRVKVDTKTGKRVDPNVPKADPTEKATTETPNPDATQPVRQPDPETTQPIVLDPAKMVPAWAQQRDRFLAQQAKTQQGDQTPQTTSAVATATTPPPPTAPMASGGTKPPAVAPSQPTPAAAPSTEEPAVAKEKKPAYKVSTGAKLNKGKAAGTKGKGKGKATTSSTQEEPFTKDDFDYDVQIMASKYGLDPADLANRGFKPHKVIANLKGMERQRNIEKLGLTREELAIQKSKDRQAAKVQKGKEAEQKSVLKGIKADAASYDKKIRYSAKLKPKQETSGWKEKERKEGTPTNPAEAERQAFRDYTTGPAADYDTRAAARKKVIDQNTSLRAAKQKEAAKQQKAAEKDAEKKQKAEFDAVVGKEKSRIQGLIDTSKAKEKALKREIKAKRYRKQMARNLTGIVGNIFGRTLTSVGRLSKGMAQKPSAHF